MGGSPLFPDCRLTESSSGSSDTLIHLHVIPGFVNVHAKLLTIRSVADDITIMEAIPFRKDVPARDRALIIIEVPGFDCLWEKRFRDSHHHMPRTIKPGRAIPGDAQTGVSAQT